MNPSMLERLSMAGDFYSDRGFKYMQVPWIVGQEADDSCRPTERQAAHLSWGFRKNDVPGSARLPGSGEQGFVQLMLLGKMLTGDFHTCTPCFRAESILDETHRLYFMKTELICNCGQHSVSDVVRLAADFFGQFLPVEVVPTGDKTYGDHFDIVYKDIELGSYGVRRHGEYLWIYGTGCAEPRLDVAIRRYRENK